MRGDCLGEERGQVTVRRVLPRGGAYIDSCVCALLGRGLFMKSDVQAGAGR